MGQVTSFFQDCREGRSRLNKFGAAVEPWEAIEAVYASEDEVHRTSLDIYPPRVHGNPPVSFDPSVDEVCEEIDAAAKGWGTDEKALIMALATKSPAERYEICVRYKQLHEGKSLQSLIKSECGGDMGLALQLLAMPPDEADALLVRQALRGMGARERYLYPILCGRSNKEMALLKEAYYTTYDEDMAVRIDKELGGEFKKLVVRCLQGSEQTFEKEWHTEERAGRYAEALYNCGQARWGTDEMGVFKIICQAPPPHLANVNRIYSEKYGQSVLNTLDSELGGDAKRGCVYMAGIKLQPYRTVARQIKLACQGFGTDEMALTALIIRYQSILAEVDKEHKEMYEGKSLEERIKEEAGGQYEDLLVEVIKSAS